MVPKGLERDLNYLVPTTRGVWGHLVYSIGLMYSIELRLLAEVEERWRASDGVLRLWAAAPEEGAHLSIFVVEWWTAHDWSRDDGRAARKYIVGDPTVPIRWFDWRERSAATDWSRRPWERNR